MFFPHFNVKYGAIKEINSLDDYAKGAGSFATVYRAAYRGRPVALKQPHSRCSEADQHGQSGGLAGPQLATTGSSDCI